MTGMRGLYIFLSIVAVVFMVLFTAASFALRGEAAWDDLLLNLSAEVFGILATVFFIERIIRSREELAWLPVKHLIYNKLLEAIRRFEQDLAAALDLADVLTSDPGIDRHTQQMRLQDILVNACVNPVLEIRDMNQDEPHVDPLSFAGFWARAYSGKIHPVVLGYRTVLGEVLDTSTHLLEPALLDRVHQLDGQIVEALEVSDVEIWSFSEYSSMPWHKPREVLDRYLREKVNEYVEPLSSALAEVIQQSGLLKDWIENERTKHFGM